MLPFRSFNGEYQILTGLGRLNLRAVVVHFLLSCLAWQNMEKDKALERRFQQVFVKQPNVEDTVSGCLTVCKYRCTVCNSWVCVEANRPHRMSEIGFAEASLVVFLDVLRLS